MKLNLFISAVVLSACIHATAQNYNSGPIYVNGPVYDASATNGSQVATNGSVLVQSGGTWAFNNGKVTTPRTSALQSEIVNFNSGSYTRTTGFVNGYASATNQVTGFILPIGQATYMPLTINSALTAGNIITAAWYDDQPQATTIVSGELFYFMPGYYDINASVTGVSVNPMIPSGTLAGTRLFGTVNGVTFTDLGPVSTTSASLPVATYRLLFANSSFTLPLTLLSFTATKQGSAGLLTWKIGMEENVQRYIVERSADGRSFEAIGSIPSLGNTSQERVYKLQDASPLRGVNHYRLRMVDADGKNRYSDVQRLTFESSITILVYPNPVKEKLRISGLEAGMHISITNLQGQQVVMRKTIGNTIDISMQQLPAAIYDIAIRDINGKLKSSTRIAKE